MINLDWIKGFLGIRQAPECVRKGIARDGWRVRAPMEGMNIADLGGSFQDGISGR